MLKSNTAKNVCLSVASGALLGLSFPPIPSGVFAYVAFIPFFFLCESIQTYAYGRTFRYAYLIFFVCNAITLYWAGGFTHGRDCYLMTAGALLLLSHPFFFTLPILAWTAFRRRCGFTFGIISFPFFWVSFEYLHSLSEISFPWLTLGNSQSYNLFLIQMISYTGIYALSFWILFINVMLFFVIRNAQARAVKFFSLRTAGYFCVIVVVCVIPMFIGAMLFQQSSDRNSKNNIRIGIVQPNIDPFEKWQNSPEYSLGLLKQVTNKLVKDSVSLVLWPETAIPFFILHPSNTDAFQSLRHYLDTINTNLLTGYSDIHYYHDDENIPKSSKISSSGLHYDTYNASMLLQVHDFKIQKYQKISLVPFAERVPFSETLSFLNATQWNFGLGGWAIGQETTVFHLSVNKKQVYFSNLICYESIYPELVASFVKNGAEFLTVITNDSWWGNTSGTYQHQRFAVLRAVENHRWVIQCANGGISCIINPQGQVLQSTEMFTQRALVGEIGKENDLTFYTRHGEWFAELCTIMSIFLIGLIVSAKFYSFIRRRRNYEVH